MKKLGIILGCVAVLVGIGIISAQDIGGRTTATSLANPRVTGVAFTNAAVDVTEYVGTLKVVQSVVLGGTTPTNYGFLMTSTGSVASGTWTLVTNFAEVVTATNVQSLTIDTRTINKFLRHHHTVAGTTPTNIVSVIMVGTTQNQ